MPNSSPLVYIDTTGLCRPRDDGFRTWLLESWDEALFYVIILNFVLIVLVRTIVIATRLVLAKVLRWEWSCSQELYLIKENFTKIVIVVGKGVVARLFWRI